MSSLFKKYPAFLGSLIALVILVLDQVSKQGIIDFFTGGPGPIRDPILLTSFWKIVLVFNRGVSFGLLSQDAQMGVYLLSGITFLVTLGLFVWLLKSTSFILSIGLGLMIGGALGNIVDRLRFGAVVDFLYFHYQNYAFPAFNLADSGITIGVGFILLDSLFSARRS